MKKKYILLPFFCAFLYIVLSSYSFGPGSGGLGDLTGASGGGGCGGGSCHGSSSTSGVSISIQLLDAGTPVSTYVGSHAYTIRITGTTTTSFSLAVDHFGFQASVVGAGTTTNKGTLSPPSGAHMGTYGGISIVEHSSPIACTSGTGFSGTTYVVNIPWTSPTAGTGCVTINTALNAVHYDGINDANDKWNTASYSIGETISPITGTTSVCPSLTTTLSDATTGGTWSSSAAGVATVGTSSGVVTGVSAGTSVISYTSCGGYVTTTVTVNPTPTVPFGTTSICATSTTTLGDITPAGTWSSGNTSVATIGVLSGAVSAVSAGTSMISYTTSTFGCFSTLAVTVNPLPGAITGTPTVCVGGNTTLSDGGGGTWSSGNTSVATIGTSGTVTGASAGTSVITYTLATGCKAFTTVTVTSAVSAITGTFATCPGTTASVSDGGGGTWSSGTTSVATIGTSGVVSAVSGGTTTLTYTLGACAAFATFTVYPTPPLISGVGSVCVGLTTNLTDGAGTWLSSNTGVATIGSSSGIAGGVVAGTAIITYTAPTTSCMTTTVITVNPLPAAISGSAGVCIGSITNLSDASGGGTWASTTTSVATIDAGTGDVSGVALGTTIITFTSGTGCIATRVETVNPLPSAITGPSSVCVGANMTLSDGGGGTWSSSNTALATVGTSGVVTGVSNGFLNITYTLPVTGCIKTALIIVNPLPNPISGGSSVCAGAGTTLSDISGSGTWSSSNTSVATIGSISGFTGGVASGTATISYIVTTSGCFATRTETVNAAPAAISGTANMCIGATTTLSSTSGGNWSSGSAGVATVGSSSGTVTGVAAGTSVITYTLNGCNTTRVVTVSALPSGISGTVGLCEGSATTLTDGSGAGTWISSSTSTATIGSASGVLSGVSAGTTTITFTLNTTGCSVTRTATVNPSPASITGVFTVCAGLTTTLSDGSGSSTWSSSNAGVATVGASTGVVTGVAAGTANITFAMPVTGCTAVQNVAVNARAPISGLSSMCAGLTTTLTDAVTGGTWSSSNAAVASIASSGTMRGVSAGTAVISYVLSSGCTSTSTVTIVSAPSAITGTTNACIGATTTLSDVGGGTWSSSNTAVATIGTSGTVGGVSLGSATITFSLGTSCIATTAITVNAVPAGITGTAAVCEGGGTTTLSDGTSGGAWSSSNGNATIGSSTSGIVTGATAGSSVISYTLGTGCSAVKTVTVNQLPVAIGGASAVCIGATTTLTDATGSGTWSSSNTSVATVIAGTGVAGGVSVGTTVITYKLPTGCYITSVFSVNPLPGAITGTTSVCAGSTTTLGDPAPGGTWSSSNANASVGSTTGVVTGVAAGTSFITYTLGTGCRTITTVTVNALPIPFTVTGGGGYCAGGSGLHILLSGSTSGISYQLYNGSATAGAAVTGSGTSIDFGLITVAGTYTVSATNGSTTCANGMAGSAVITVNPLPSAITGTTTVCSGAITTLGDATGGGTWASAGTTIATIGSATGDLSGVSGGTTTVSYILSTGCYVTTSVRVNPTPTAITGSATVCAGATTTLSDAMGGGTWATGGAGMASVGSSTGVVTGLTAGTESITYALPTGCMTSTEITVNTSPAAIGGTGAICVGATLTLSDATGGGNWSGGGSFATVGSATGVVTGASGGNANITYTISNGCTAATVVTVNPLPAGISGPASVCTGVTVTMSDASGGGTWSSSNTSVATANATTGVISGVAAGSATISYILSTGCMISRSLTVNPSPVAGTISGPTHQCGDAAPITLTSSGTGGVWSSSNTAVATVGTGSGVVTAVSSGITIITYSVTTVCGTDNATHSDTVLAIPPAGIVVGADSVCAGSTIVLTDVAVAGVWSSSNTSVASVSSTGTVSGVAAGNAIISYSVFSGCGTAVATLSVTVKSLAACNVGVKELNEDWAVKVYPNPSGGSFIVDLPAASAGATIIITDVLGKVTATKEIADARAQKVMFNLTNMPAGLYVIRINAGDHVYRKQVEIVR